jgi:hypothetical protein
MKGIYLTEEGKQEIESRIAELEKYNYEDEKLNGDLEGHIYALKEILSSAIILPIEESWERLSLKAVGSTHAVPSAIVEKFENGVIIQPK